MKNTFLICLLSICSALAHAANDSNFTIEKGVRKKSLYACAIQSVKDDRCEKKYLLQKIPTNVLTTLVKQNAEGTTRWDILIKKDRSTKKKALLARTVALHNLKESWNAPQHPEKAIGYTFEEKDIFTHFDLCATKGRIWVMFSKKPPFFITLTSNNIPEEQAQGFTNKKKQTVTMGLPHTIPTTIRPDTKNEIFAFLPINVKTTIECGGILNRIIVGKHESCGTDDPEVSVILNGRHNIFTPETFCASVEDNGEYNKTARYGGMLPINTQDITGERSSKFFSNSFDTSELPMIGSLQLHDNAQVSITRSTKK